MPDENRTARAAGAGTTVPPPDVVPVLGHLQGATDDIKVDELAAQVQRWNDQPRGDGDRL